MDDGGFRRSTKGQIDSATFTELILLFSHQRPRDGLADSWRASLEATIALIDTDDLRFAPGTGDSSGRTLGPYAVLASGLEAFGLRGARIEGTHWRRRTLKETQDWGLRNVWTLREHRDAIVAESSAWLEQDRILSWENHRVLHGALFDDHFIPQLAAATNIGERDVRRLWQQTTDATAVKRFVTASSATDGDLTVVQDLYLYAWLLRGRYHDRFAQRSRSQILHHAYRERTLDRLGTESREFDVAPATFFLAMIIVADAFAARTLDERIARWCRSVGAARLTRAQRFLDAETDEARARTAAIKAALALNVGSSSSALSTALDEALTLGLVVPAAAFIVERFGLPPGLSGDYARAIVERVAEPVRRRMHGSVRRLRLNQLSRIWPGRITRLWRTSR